VTHYNDIQTAIDVLRPQIESMYPLALKAVRHHPMRGDHGWKVDYVIDADRHGPMSLFDLSDLEDWIKDKTGFAVLINSRPARGSETTSRAAAE
jgi:hypothetical protein